MPAIRSQVITATGLILTLSPSADLPGVSTLELQITRQGNGVTARILSNGIEVALRNLQSPTAAELEAQINDSLGGRLKVTIRGQQVPVLNCLVHVFTVTPLRLAIISTDGNITPPISWWEEET